jgi:hypothetical protein
VSQMIRFCPECGDDRLFEPYHGEPGGCPDSPDGDCPEWGCAACGTALLVGLVAAGGTTATATELPGRVA